MLRVLSQNAAALVLTTALGAAPAASSPNLLHGAPGQTNQTKHAINTQKPQVGKASWYGQSFQHKRTASGELFNMYQFTAAHRTLPLGSWVKVTDLKNDRSVIVRINDRGPVPKNRIIDLSYGAAKKLGMSENGVHPVRVELIDTPTISQTEGEVIVNSITKTGKRAELNSKRNQRTLG
jgi:rare lipoprotein A